MVRATVLLIAILFSFTASARSNDPNAVKARALFTSGLAHYNLGEWDAALDDFAQGYRVKLDPVFLFNLGQAQRRKGNPEAALLNYESYLREVPRASNRTQVEGFMEEARRAIAAKAAKPSAVLAPQAEPGKTEMSPPNLAAPNPTTSQSASTPATSLVAAQPVQPAHKPRRVWPIAIGVAAGVLVAGAVVGVAVVETRPNVPSYEWSLR